ncbi:MAG: hypothetical protein JKY56_10870 [Kofleriaceae bacterium]|nr:hypothetical protein [Kofleriaceae bacterium]
MENETKTTENKTTFHTWGRLAKEQISRMGDIFQQSFKLQTAALEQSKELFAYNMKLANDYQNWATKTPRKVADKLFKTK